MLKVFLMTRNETNLLEDWIKYHGYLFGLTNIHILDGSDDPYVFGLYAKYKRLGLNVHFSSAGLNELAEEMTQLMHEHKGKNNFLIKLDTDEFLAYTSPFCPSPKGALSTALQEEYIKLERRPGGIKKKMINFLMDRKYASKSLQVDSIQEMFNKLPVTGQRYKASFTVWSLPTQEAMVSPARNLTRFTPLQFTHIKSFFHSASFESVDLGCHNGQSTRHDGFIETGLSLIHYHATCLNSSVRRARQVLLSHEYIDEEDSVTEQQKKLMALKSKGRFSSWHKVDLYLRYLVFLNGGEVIEPASLCQSHPYFRQSGSPIELTLVRDMLDEIDRKHIFRSAP